MSHSRRRGRGGGVYGLPASHNYNFGVPTEEFTGDVDEMLPDSSPFSRLVEAPDPEEKYSSSSSSSSLTATTPLSAPLEEKHRPVPIEVLKPLEHIIIPRPENDDGSHGIKQAIYYDDATLIEARRRRQALDEKSAYYNERYYETNLGRRVFIVPKDKIPRNKQDFLKFISPHIDDFEFVGKKSGGINDAGPRGGNYKFYYTIEGDVYPDDHPNAGKPIVRSQMQVIKQDNGYKNKIKNVVNKLTSRITTKKVLGDKQVLNSKVIGEFVGSRIMNAMIGNSGSTIFYAMDANAGKPDRTGKGVYIGSVFFDNYDDLYRDIARVQGIPVSGVDPGVNYKRLQNAGTWNNDIFEAGMLQTNSNNEILFYDKNGNVSYTKKPTNKLSLAYDYKDPYGHTITEEYALKLGGSPRCRYHDLARVCIVSLLLGDFDIHTGNLGVIANRNPDGTTAKGSDDPRDFLRDDKGNIISDEFYKIGRLVRIDQAAGLHDLTDEINPHSQLDHLPGIGPTCHWREFSRHLRISKESAEEAERIANFDQGVLRQTITSALNETALYYGSTPIYEFMHRMGMTDENIQSMLEKTSGMRLTVVSVLFDSLKSGTLNNTNDDRLKRHLVNGAIEFSAKKCSRVKLHYANMLLTLK